MRYFLCGDDLIDGRVKRLHELDGIIVSKSFIICADEQLFHNFLLTTGVKNIKKCGLSGSVYNLTYDTISSYETNMGVNSHNQAVRICWRSKSGKIYHLHDEVDCNDVEFWLEGVDVPLVYKQLYGPTALPFKLPPTHYQLVIGSISISLDLKVVLKEAQSQTIGQLAQNMDNFIDGFNAKSLKKDRKDGIVHNWKTTTQGRNLLVEMDLGSAGSAFLKKMLKWLNGFECVEKVVVGTTADN